MSRIFLSHSNTNNPEALALRDWLATQGWNDVFLDLDPERGLKAGERWQAALKRAAERCELVIFLISPAWTASKWCLAEFLLAKSLNKRIFGVIVETTGFADLPTEMTSEWQLVDLSVGSRDYQASVNVPPGNTTVTVAFGNDGLNRLRLGLARAGLDPRYFAWPPETDPDRPPYRGLSPLEAEDAGIFFGRDGPVVLGLDLLRGLREAATPRLLVILGASGAGKSSFMRAGLWPRLARESDLFLPLPVLRPERAALSGATGFISVLEQALKNAGQPRSRTAIRAAINGGGASARSMLAELFGVRGQSLGPQGASPKLPPTLVLPIDQAEELFLAEGADEAHAFLTLLRDLLIEDAPAFIALFTIRSDGYERLQIAAELEGLRQQFLSLPPMPQGAYADVIKGPARRLEGGKRALKIEDALVDALLADIEAGGAKDSLPLLAFTLERLYREHGGDGDLRLSEYEQLGRVKGSIEAAVERAFKAADTDPKIPRDRDARLALLRRGLIPWLAGIDPDTGSPRRRVARLSEIPAEARPLIDHLVEQRLLATDVSKDTGEKTIEPAHEALLRQWGLLQSWLVEDAALLTVLDTVKRAARDWSANAKHGSWLIHSGERLKAAHVVTTRLDLVAHLEPTDREYLDQCRQAETEGSRLKRRTKSVAACLSVAILLIGLGWYNETGLRRTYYWLSEVKPYLLTRAAERALKSKEEFQECKDVCPRMIVIPQGRFAMGSTEFEGEKDEHPQHDVVIPKIFAMSQDEITFREWQACLDHGWCTNNPDDQGWGRDERPVIDVSWYEAKQYVSWLSSLTGQHYRLVSETEWEWAARAGSPSRYSFGDDAATLTDYAWYSENSENTTHEVGQKSANGYGLFDMHGNVWEWLEDCYSDSYGVDHSSLPDKREDEQVEPARCDRRVIRGGAWNSNEESLRSAERKGSLPEGKNDSVGFRVARDLKR